MATSKREVAQKRLAHEQAEHRDPLRNWISEDAHRGRVGCDGVLSRSDEQRSRQAGHVQRREHEKHRGQRDERCGTPRHEAPEDAADRSAGGDACDRPFRVVRIEALVDERPERRHHDGSDERRVKVDGKRHRRRRSEADDPLENERDRAAAEEHWQDRRGRMAHHQARQPQHRDERQRRRNRDGAWQIRGWKRREKERVARRFSRDLVRDHRRRRERRRARADDHSRERHCRKRVTSALRKARVKSCLMNAIQARRRARPARSERVRAPHC
jgi:hypothetical protein